MKNPRFIIKQAHNGQCYFVLTAKNGKVIAQSEMFNSMALCTNTIRSVQENAPMAEVEDMT